MEREKSEKLAPRWKTLETDPELQAPEFAVTLDRSARPISLMHVRWEQNASSSRTQHLPADRLTFAVRCWSFAARCSSFAVLRPASRTTDGRASPGDWGLKTEG